MSEYPESPDQHQIERESMTILESFLSPYAILKKIDDYDYGIDCIIEFREEVDGKFVVTGKEIYAQVKGTRNKKINRNTTTPSPQIKISTANYWMEKETPVFLFFVNITDKVIGFSNATMFLKKTLSLDESRKSITIPIPPSLRIKNGDISHLVNEYQLHKEFQIHLKNLRDIVLHLRYVIRDLILSAYKKHDIVIDNVNKDNRYRKISSIFTKIHNASLFFQYPCIIKNLDYYINRCKQDYNGKITEWALTKASRAIQFNLSQLIGILLASKDIFTWERIDKDIFEALNDDSFISLAYDIAYSRINRTNINELGD
ncbi:DUF4365 domain-containing protein [Morganella morganii]|uniref:DUF4365 domain-containing protein n=1 Tax=Morganella morganii TaxID=582 RepID=UPI002367775C|nr:DUF4365 domain-containing protein [Morganella morganii]